LRRKSAGGSIGRSIFRGAGTRGSRRASFVWQPGRVLAGESALVASEPLDTWKRNLLAYHVIEALWLRAAEGDVRGRAIRFFSGKAAGRARRKQRPRRWARASGHGELVALGDAVGQNVREAVFPARKSKARVEKMVGQHRGGISAKRIDAADVDGPRNEGGRQKRSLNTLYVGIGVHGALAGLFPVRKSRPTDIFRGILWRGKFLYVYHRGNRDALGKPVDRHEWTDDAARRWNAV